MPTIGLSPISAARVIDEDQVQSRTNTRNRPQCRGMILPEHEPEVQALRQQAVYDARIFRYAARNETGILGQKVGRYRRNHGDAIVRKCSLSAKILLQ